MLKLTVDQIFPKNIKRKKTFVHKSPNKSHSKKHKESLRNIDKIEENIISNQRNQDAHNLNSIKEEENLTLTEDDNAASTTAIINDPEGQTFSFDKLLKEEI